MVQNARKGRLHPAVGAARVEAAKVLNSSLGAGTVAASGKNSGNGGQPGEAPLLLVGLSGGADSLALAATLAHFARRGELRVGAVVVNHQLQDGSAQAASRAAEQARELGLEPVLIETVTVDTSTEGPEKAAQLARYGAFERAVTATGARALALAHTRDDQAETVLLGLARGSGTRSLAGMPQVRVDENVTYLRPLLNITRAQVEDICEAEGLEPWHDPTNNDQTMMRAKVRHSIMPYLEENLGGGVATSLARTATIVGADTDYIASQAQMAYESVILDTVQLKDARPGKNQQAADTLHLPQDACIRLALDRAALAELHPALRLRVLARAVVQAGGETPGFERLSALDDFAATAVKGGPLQLAGHVAAYKIRPPVLNAAGKSLRKSGILVFTQTQEPVDL